jgi:hypothetical protein
MPQGAPECPTRRVSRASRVRTRTGAVSCVVGPCSASFCLLYAELLCFLCCRRARPERTRSSAAAPITSSFRTPGARGPGPADRPGTSAPGRPRGGAPPYAARWPPARNSGILLPKVRDSPGEQTCILPVNIIGLIGSCRNHAASRHPPVAPPADALQDALSLPTAFPTGMAFRFLPLLPLPPYGILTVGG